MIEKKSTIYDTSTTFDSYMKAASEKEAFIRSFQNRFTGNPKGTSFLDLGCNNGTLTMRYLEAVANKLGTNPKIACVEPNTSAFANLESKSKAARITFDYFNQSAEAFLSANTNKFNWVIASHSLYWTNSLEKILLEIHQVAENAVVVIREKGGLHEFENKFRHLIPKPQNPMYSGDDVVSALQRNAIEYEREIVQTSIAIPPVGTSQYRELLALLLDTPEHQWSDELFQKASEYLNGFHEFFPYNVGFYWIKGANYGN